MEWVEFLALKILWTEFTLDFFFFTNLSIKMNFQTQRLAQVLMFKIIQGVEFNSAYWKFKEVYMLVFNLYR